MSRDVEDVIETAVGGKNLTTTIEGRQRFPVRVRYARDFRDNPQQLGEVLVTGSNGAQVPLEQGRHHAHHHGPLDDLAAKTACCADPFC